MKYIVEVRAIYSGVIEVDAESAEGAEELAQTKTEVDGLYMNWEEDLSAFAEET